VRRLPIAVAGAEHEMIVAADLLGDGTTIVDALAAALTRVGRDAPTSVHAIVDAAVAETHATRLRAALATVGMTMQWSIVEATETNKSIDTVDRLAREMIAAGVDRHALVLGIGGGIVTDLAGFAAATYLRGIPCVLVPTTLLAMVDAAIGGKTGANVALADGALAKNSIGTFTQPLLVLADPGTLATLSPRLLRCGFAECVKHAFIADATLLDEIEADTDSLLAGDIDSLTRLITRSAAIKIDVVVGDERERGDRAHLNLGHTFAHAIESEQALRLLHGEAVAIGLVAAARVAVSMDRLDAASCERLFGVLTRLGLPTALAGPHEFTTDIALRRMGFDKKSHGGRLRLVLPDGLGRVSVVADPPLELVVDAWRSVGVIAASTQCGETRS